MHENRETSGAPRMKADRGRSEKVQSRKAGMHASEESDHAIVPMKPAEQRRLLFSGGWGGKGVGQGEHRPVQHESDTERETSVPRIERCATSSKGKEAGTFHRFASPCDSRVASGQLLRIEAESGTRGRRCHMAGV